MKKVTLQINFDRLKSTIHKSAEIGAIPGNGLRRLALSNEDKIMRDVLLEWMQGARLETKVDDFGNMFGRRGGKTDLSPLLIGSHLDTQPNGGRFDGILGVLTALEVVRTLNDQQIETVRPIEIVNFTNEEGARFEPALLGSGGAIGAFSKEYVYSRTDKFGNTFGDELENIGYKGESSNRPVNLHAFIELHIEQGPILENEQVDIGAVEGIKGMTWLEFKVKGNGGHAGPTPMALRKDALMAASKLIVHIEEKSKRTDAELSVTVGRMSIKPDVVNCIPEEVIFSLDVRHVIDDVRENFISQIKKELQEICKKEQVEVEVNELWEVSTTHFDPEIINQIIRSAHTFGLSTTRLYSGAGHDAKYMSEITPTGMIFLPSIGGISHVESELTLDKDIENGANVLLDIVLEMANRMDA